MFQYQDTERQRLIAKIATAKLQMPNQALVNNINDDDDFVTCYKCHVDLRIMKIC